MNPTYMDNTPSVARQEAHPLAVMVVTEALDAIASAANPVLAARAQGFGLDSRAIKVVARETGIDRPSEFVITDYTQVCARVQLRRMLTGALLAAFESGLHDADTFAERADAAIERLKAAEAKSNG